MKNLKRTEDKHDISVLNINSYLLKSDEDFKI